MPPVTVADLNLPPPVEGTKEVAARVLKARRIQAERFAGMEHDTRAVNADLSSKQIEEVCLLDDASRKLLTDAAERFSLSARAYHRVLKLARTIADLDGERNIARHHLAEALTYRWRDPAVSSLLTA